jgi:hypothetical protein
LPATRKIWDSIAIDFITGLQEDSAINAMVIVVDRFSKMAHVIPTTEVNSACETAKLLLFHVSKLHGTPPDIISDRRPRFVSSVWKTPCQRLIIERKVSTAYHP